MKHFNTKLCVALHFDKYSVLMLLQDMTPLPCVVCNIFLYNSSQGSLHDRYYTALHFNKQPVSMLL